MVKRIFIVEDEMILSSHLSAFFEKNGFEVEVLGHGEECLERLEEGTTPDLILMDLNLGKNRRGGAETTREIYRNYDVPVVIHSAYTDKETLDATRGITKYGYVQKVPGNEHFLLATAEMAIKLYRTEKMLRESEGFYRTTLSSISDTVFVTDEDGRFVYVCPNVGAIFGYTVEEVEAFGSITPFIGEVPVSDEELDREGEKRNIRIHVYDKWGRQHIVLVNVKKVKIRNGKRLYVCRDVTELTQKQRELERSEKMYRELSTHLQDIREQQNAYLAREIHDDLGQALTALKMNLSVIRRSAEAPGGSTERIVGTAEDMDDILDTMVKKVRKISTELRPSVLDAGGIVEALEWQLEEFNRYFGVTVKMTGGEEEIPLDKTKSLAVFRIVQESMTNSVRHGEAREVSIHLQCEGGLLSIRVEDNGRGFELDEAERGSTFGLIGMRERALQCGGDLSVESAPGRGTTVRVTIPL